MRDLLFRLIGAFLVLTGIAAVSACEEEPAPVVNQGGGGGSGGDVDGGIQDNKPAESDSS